MSFAFLCAGGFFLFLSCADFRFNFLSFPMRRQFFSFSFVFLFLLFARAADFPF
jgi:hypothetical protein